MALAEGTTTNVQRERAERLARSIRRQAKRRDRPGISAAQARPRSISDLLRVETQTKPRPAPYPRRPSSGPVLSTLKGAWSAIDPSALWQKESYAESANPFFAKTQVRAGEAVRPAVGAIREAIREDPFFAGGALAGAAIPWGRHPSHSWDKFMHGTGATFREFERRPLSPHGVKGQGVYGSTLPERAGEYAEITPHGVGSGGRDFTYTPRFSYWNIRRPQREQAQGGVGADRKRNEFADKHPNVTGIRSGEFSFQPPWSTSFRDVNNWDMAGGYFSDLPSKAKRRIRGAVGADKDEPIFLSRYHYQDPVAAQVRPFAVSPKARLFDYRAGLGTEDVAGFKKATREIYEPMVRALEDAGDTTARGDLQKRIEEINIGPLTEGSSIFWQAEEFRNMVSRRVGTMIDDVGEENLPPATAKKLKYFLHRMDQTGKTSPLSPISETLRRMGYHGVLDEFYRSSATGGGTGKEVALFDPAHAEPWYQKKRVSPGGVHKMNLIERQMPGFRKAITSARRENTAMEIPLGGEMSVFVQGKRYGVGRAGERPDQELSAGEAIDKVFNFLYGTTKTDPLARSQGDFMHSFDPEIEEVGKLLESSGSGGPTINDGIGRFMVAAKRAGLDPDPQKAAAETGPFTHPAGWTLEAGEKAPGSTRPRQYQITDETGALFGKPGEGRFLNEGQFLALRAKIIEDVHKRGWKFHPDQMVAEEQARTAASQPLRGPAPPPALPRGKVPPSVSSTLAKSFPREHPRGEFSIEQHSDILGEMLNSRDGVPLESFSRPPIVETYFDPGRLTIFLEKANVSSIEEVDAALDMLQGGLNKLWDGHRRGLTATRPELGLSEVERLAGLARKMRRRKG